MDFGDLVIKVVEAKDVSKDSPVIKVRYSIMKGIEYRAWPNKHVLEPV